MLSKEQIVILLLIAGMLIMISLLIFDLDDAIGGFFYNYYLPSTLACASVMLLSLTKLSNSKIVILSAIPIAVYAALLFLGGSF